MKYTLFIYREPKDVPEGESKIEYLAKKVYTSRIPLKEESIQHEDKLYIVKDMENVIVKNMFGRLVNKFFVKV